MQQEAQTLETKLQHLTSELSAKQKQLDNVHIKLEQKLAIQDEEFKSSAAILRAKLDTLQLQIKESTELFFKQRQEQELQISKVDSEITDLNYTKDILTRDRLSLSTEKATLSQELEVLQEDIKTAQATKSELELATSSLETLKSQKSEEITELNSQKSDIEDKIQILDKEYAEKVVVKEELLSRLDMKIVKVSQEVENSEKADKATREAFAQRQAEQDIRDQNLRIREQQLEQNEARIIQNSMLLNL